MSQAEFNALQQLSSNKDIVIQKSDKGNSVVIVNRKDYIERMQSLVNDNTKFEKLNVKDGKDYNFMVKVKGLCVIFHEPLMQSYPYIVTNNYPKKIENIFMWKYTLLKICMCSTHEFY